MTGSRLGAHWRIEEMLVSDQMSSMPSIEGTPNPIADSSKIDIGTPANQNGDASPDPGGGLSWAETQSLTGTLVHEGGKTD